MLRLINRFRRDDEGAALVEYGMLVGLIGYRERKRLSAVCKLVSRS